jgi:hypothetical protein
VTPGVPFPVPIASRTLVPPLAIILFGTREVSPPPFAAKHATMRVQSRSGLVLQL